MSTFVGRTYNWSYICSESPFSGSALYTEVGYWTLPKPADLFAATWLKLNPEPLENHITEFAKIREKGGFCPACSMTASVIFAAIIVAISGYELETADY